MAIKTDLSALWLWRDFCHARGVIAFDEPPETELIEQFLSQHGSGMLPEVRLASAELVKKLESAKNSVPALHWLWGQHCFSNAFGIEDPKRLPEGMVLTFLQSYETGSFQEIDEIELASQELVDSVVALKQFPKWRAFCRARHTGSNDPACVPANLAREFIAQCKLEQVEVHSRDESSSKYVQTQETRNKTKLENTVARFLRRTPGLLRGDIVYKFEEKSGNGSLHAYKADVTLTQDLRRRKLFRDLGDIPLTVEGTWQSSKRKAQDAVAGRFLLIISHAVLAASLK